MRNLTPVLALPLMIAAVLFAAASRTVADDTAFQLIRTDAERQILSLCGPSAVDAALMLPLDPALRTRVAFRVVPDGMRYLRQVPEDVRARILLAAFYAEEGRQDDAVREANLAMLLRPNEAMVHYNAACTFCAMNKRTEALDALAKAWGNGFRDADWARRDPSLTILRGDPEFEKLYPARPD